MATTRNARAHWEGTLFEGEGTVELTSSGIGTYPITWAARAEEPNGKTSPEELIALYEGKGVTKDKDVITYCRIGERSSHTWFVLKYLLGYPNVRNYDGSWTEWGNLVRSPIEK